MRHSVLASKKFVKTRTRSTKLILRVDGRQPDRHKRHPHPLVRLLARFEDRLHHPRPSTYLHHHGILKHTSLSVVSIRIVSHLLCCRRRMRSLGSLVLFPLALTSSTVRAFVPPNVPRSFASNNAIGGDRSHHSATVPNSAKSSLSVAMSHRLSSSQRKRRQQWTSLHSSKPSDTLEGDPKGDEKISFWDRIRMTFSTLAASKVAKKYGMDFNPASEAGLNTMTLIRVGIPSILSGVLAFVAFPAMSMWLCSLWTDAGVFAVLSQDSSQFVQNFLTVAGLLFSILVGQTYYFMYQQQEMIYYALFNEVTEAKSLLEQVALVCQGRSMYPRVLGSIKKYVESDLKKLHADPAVLLSARPMDDPLETIMYLTSVGVPSTVYETIRSLRQARAQRLGALQRKLPQVHMLLLWILAALELVSFPLLGAGTQTIGGYNILSIEGCLFGLMTTGIVMTLRVSIRFD